MLTPAEVARTFGVDPKTVTRWAKAGKLPSICTPGNHRRYKESDVRALYNGTAECISCHYPLNSSGHRVTCLRASS